MPRGRRTVVQPQIAAHRPVRRGIAVRVEALERLEQHQRLFVASGAQFFRRQLVHCLDVAILERPAQWLRPLAVRRSQERCLVQRHRLLQLARAHVGVLRRISRNHCPLERIDVRREHALRIQRIRPVRLADHALVEQRAPQTVQARVKVAVALRVRQIGPKRREDLFLADGALRQQEEEHLLALLAPPLQVRHLPLTDEHRSATEGERLHRRQHLRGGRDSLARRGPPCARLLRLDVPQQRLMQMPHERILDQLLRACRVRP